MELLKQLQKIGIIGGTFLAASGFLLFAPKSVREREIANAEARLAARRAALSPSPIQPKIVYGEEVKAEERIEIDSIKIIEFVEEVEPVNATNDLQIDLKKLQKESVGTLTKIAKDLGIPTYRSGQNRRKGKQELLADIVAQTAIA